MKTKEQKIQHLLSKGWTLISGEHFGDPESPTTKQRGGLCFDFAYRKQIERDSSGRSGFYYKLLKLQRREFDYGYEILRINSSSSDKRREAFSYSEELSREWVEKLNCGEDFIMRSEAEKNLPYCLKEKEYDCCYYVPTLEKFNKAVFDIFRTYLDNDIIGDFDNEEPTKPELDKLLIEKLKDGSIKRIILQEWKRYEEDLKNFNEETEAKKEFKRAKEGDAIAAWRILHDEGKLEYLGMREL